MFGRRHRWATLISRLRNPGVETPASTTPRSYRPIRPVVSLRRAGSMPAPRQISDSLANGWLVGLAEPPGGSTVNASACESPRSDSTAVVDGATSSASIVPAECGPSGRPATSGRPSPAWVARRCSSPARRRCWSWENTTVAVPPVGISPDTVRTSDAVKICSAWSTEREWPQRQSHAERAESDRHCGGDRRAPSPATVLDSAALGRASLPAGSGGGQDATPQTVPAVRVP